MTRSSRKRSTSDLVVVANRLPVDRVVDEDGNATLAPLPGRTRLGARAGDARQQRRLDRLAGRHRGRPRAVRGRRAHPGPGHHVRPGVHRVLRGLLQRHPVAALPRPRRQAVLPPRVVGLLRHRQPALRRRGREVRRRGRGRLGPGLPAPAGPGDAARAAPRPADRVLPAHPVPAGRAVLPAAVAPADPRGPARRGPGRLPALRRRRRTSSASSASASATRPTATRSTSPTAGWCRPARSRSRSTLPASRSWPAPRPVAARAEGDPARPRQPHAAVPGHRPARLHQGHLRPAACLQRADRRGRLQRRGRAVRPGRHARHASASTSTASSATTSTAWSAGSTATSDGSAGRRSPTCTRPSRARRWRPSTGPPTSWW